MPVADTESPDVDDERTFYVTGEGIWEHTVGDVGCIGGWCQPSTGYPRRCPCGGLIHADFGDEEVSGEDESFWLHTKCDQCGLSEGMASLRDRYF